METLAQRAAQSLAYHSSPALPLQELTEEVRTGGGVVGTGVLLRALQERPDLFRLLDPWRGPWRAAPIRQSGRGMGEPPAAPVGERWVVPLGPSTGYPARDPLGRLKASMIHLGRTLDERSMTDLARWLAMVRESERLCRASRMRKERPARS